jgi:HD-GYP domain-containing protein (c-di-GMP phosphodiesterase class II)
MKDSNWIAVRKSNLKYYNDVELYYKNPSEKIRLYKPAGMHFGDKALEAKPYLGDLYIKPDDKIKCLREAQKGFSQSITSHIINKEMEEVKNELVGIVDETLSEPRSGSLSILPEMVDSILSGYSKQPDIIKNLALISHTDYTTTIHSINCMALMAGYSFYCLRPEKEVQEFSLAALLHDIGKTRVSAEILTANRKLTDWEFEQMKDHTTFGKEILDTCTKEVRLASAGCIEHHEKLDGSGYPGGRAEISECGKILSLIDCYEAITNDDRPYRSALDPMKALAMLKEETIQGKFDKEVLIRFAYSLTDFTKSGKREIQKELLAGLQ